MSAHTGAAELSPQLVPQAGPARSLGLLPGHHRPSYRNQKASSKGRGAAGRVTVPECTAWRASAKRRCQCDQNPRSPWPVGTESSTAGITWESRGEGLVRGLQQVWLRSRCCVSQSVAESRTFLRASLCLPVNCGVSLPSEHCFIGCLLQARSCAKHFA